MLLEFLRKVWMLIELNHKKGDVISIKLVTGEELVARFEEETQLSCDINTM